jgi:hypothetical protein
VEDILYDVEVYASSPLELLLYQGGTISAAQVACTASP